MNTIRPQTAKFLPKTFLFAEIAYFACEKSVIPLANHRWGIV
jgi:hypothetical protein